jgi:hypothetical protein
VSQSHAQQDISSGMVWLFATATGLIVANLY